MKKHYKKLIMIAVPIMLSNMITELQILIDKMFLGQLDITCMSAVGNACSPIWTTMSAVFSLTVGATILVSQAYGAGERERAKAITAAIYKYNNIFGVGLFLFWLFGAELVFRAMGVDPSIRGMAVSYARIYSPIFLVTGIGASMTSMLEVSQKTTIMIAYGVVRSLINVVLDYAMIFGHFGFAPMGVTGAAIATTIAELIGYVIVVVYVQLDKSLWLKPTMAEIRDGKSSHYLHSIKMGVPVAAEDFAWSFGILFLLAMLNKVSIEAAGIHSIIFGIESIPIVVLIALGNAALTLAGFETGAKNHRGVWEVVMEALLMSVGFSLVIICLFRIFPTRILSMFTSDANIIATAPLYLFIIGIDLLPKAVNIIVGSGIKGYGDTVWMLVTQIGGTIFIMITSYVGVVVLHWGLVEMFVIILADESIRAVINFIHFRRIRSGKGKKLTAAV